MGKMQREKGKRGERELAGILRDYGYNCRRGQQYCGTSGDADVIGLPNVHIEVKRVEDLRLRKALQQSSRDARAGKIPVVMHPTMSRGGCPCTCRTSSGCIRTTFSTN